MNNYYFVVKMELFTLIGKIKQVKKSKKEVRFSLETITDKKKNQNKPEKHNCVCTYFCPVEPNDIIYGKCRKHKQNTIFVRPPFVYIGTTKEDIIDFLAKYLPRSNATMFYNYIKNLAGKKSISQYFSHVYDIWKNEEDDMLVDKLADLANTNTIKITKIISAWHNQFDKRRLWLLGINNREIDELLKINSDFNDLYNILLDNPLRLYCLPIDKCIQIMDRLDKTPTKSQLECAKIIRFIYDKSEFSGWTCVPKKIILRSFPNYKEYSSQLMKDYFLVDVEDMLYLQYNYLIEDNVVSIINKRKTQQTFYSDITLRPDPSLPLSEDQEKAIVGALKNKVSLICGSPGTGKTSIIKEIVFYLEKENVEYAIASFTGKAVARLRYVLNSTIPMTMHLTIKKSQQIKFDHLIIDEASMITTELFWEFLQRFDHPFSMTFVGDPNQLPPIRWGSLFQNMLETKKIPTYELIYNHRVYNVPNETDGILLNAKHILNHNPKKDKPLKFKETSNFITTKGDVDEVLAFTKAFQKQGVPYTDITVITPYNKDLEIINAHSQKFYHKGQDFVKDNFGNIWFLKDRVMMTQNDYDINVMNGEEGIVTSLEKDHIKVDFGPGREFEFPLQPETDSSYSHFYYNSSSKEKRQTNWLILSYCLTVHKSQGSEWDFVIFYIPQNKKHSKNYLNKNLVYTGLTRAKRALFFIGDTEELKNSCMRVMPYRYERLSNQISAH